jgi:hypothetical protein
MARDEILDPAASGDDHDHEAELAARAAAQLEVDPAGAVEHDPEDGTGLLHVVDLDVEVLEEGRDESGDPLRGHTHLAHLRGPAPKQRRGHGPRLLRNPEPGDHSGRSRPAPLRKVGTGIQGGTAEVVQ